MNETHELGAFYWNADSPHCKHGPEPDSETDGDAWDDWSEVHPVSEDGRICLEAPAGEACVDCSAEHGDMMPWSRCEGRDHTRPQHGIVPTPGVEHQEVPVWVGSLDCFERECDDYFTEDGDEIPSVERCSHIRAEQACSCQRQPDGEYGSDPCPAAVAA